VSKIDQDGEAIVATSVLERKESIEKENVKKGCLIICNNKGCVRAARLTVSKRSETAEK
jgi:hypothetical protein